MNWQRLFDSMLSVELKLYKYIIIIVIIAIIVIYMHYFHIILTSS